MQNLIMPKSLNIVSTTLVLNSSVHIALYSWGLAITALSQRDHQQICKHV